MGSWTSAVIRSWSIPAGRIGNAHVRVHLTFFLLLLVVWFTEAPTVGKAGMARGLALVGITLGAVIAHEFAHALAAMREPQPARVLILLPIGGVTLLDEGTHRPNDPAARTGVALAGPLMNLLLAFLAGSIVVAVAPEAQLWSRPLIFAGNLLRSFVWINAFLCGFNLLPAYPTDVGRLLRARLARRMDLVHATRQVVGLGRVFAMAFIIAGMVWGTWLMLAGFFLFVAAQLEERSVVFQSVLQNLRMEDVMLTDFATLSPADTLDDALAKAVHTLQDDFPVIRGAEMVGIITRQKIIDALRIQGNGYVQLAMNRGFQVADRGESLASALRKLTSHRLSLIPVLDDGRLVGIVTFQNLMHSMNLLAESRKLRRDAAANS